MMLIGVCVPFSRGHCSGTRRSAGTGMLLGSGGRPVDRTSGTSGGSSASSPAPRAPGLDALQYNCGMSAVHTKVRLAELVATLSLGTDLGLGQPMEHVIRQTLIALRMSELLGFDESERTVAYYSGLLAWVGCHTDAYEQAKWFGDDIGLKADAFHVG